MREQPCPGRQRRGQRVRARERVPHITHGQYPLSFAGHCVRFWDLLVLSLFAHFARPSLATPRYYFFS